MSKVWFTSDTHFGHQRTLELSRRPFSNVGAMNVTLLVDWNNVVDENDVVVHLGDFGDPKWIKELKGREIYIIPGNYDTPAIVEELAKDSRVVVGTQGVALQFLLIHANMRPVDKLSKTYLVHEPERATNPDAFYLYGHIHQLQMVKQNGLNVGVDCHQFKPIDLSVVQFYYEAIIKHYDKNVFLPKLGVQTI